MCLEFVLDDALFNNSGGLNTIRIGGCLRIVLDPPLLHKLRAKASTLNCPPYSPTQGLVLRKYVQCFSIGTTFADLDSISRVIRSHFALLLTHLQCLDIHSISYTRRILLLCAKPGRCRPRPCVSCQMRSEGLV